MQQIIHIPYLWWVFGYVAILTLIKIKVTIIIDNPIIIVILISM